MRTPRITPITTSPRPIRIPICPDALTLKNGKKVTTPEMWWNQRRPEIVEDFEREVLGRVPEERAESDLGRHEDGRVELGGHPVIGKQLVGHVDNSSYPDINVDIQMTLVVPADAQGSGAGDDDVRRRAHARSRRSRAGLPDARPGAAGSARRARRSARDRATASPMAGATPPSTPAASRPTTAPASPRASSAWPTKASRASRTTGARCGPGRWGASRGLDYLETDKAVDAKHVGIEGVSRYGKAALVTMAFDHALRGGAGRLVGRRRRQAAPPQFRRGGREPHGLRRISLDGRQLPEVRRLRSDLRQQERRRPAGGRARADRAVRAAAHLHQLRRAREGRRQMARPAGQLHGRRRRGAGVPAARREGPRACRTTTARRRCRRSTSGCSTASSPGASTTAATPTRRTGSTSSPGPTSSSHAPRPLRPLRIADRALPIQPLRAPTRTRMIAHAAAAGEGEDRAASTSTSKATPSRAAGAPPTIRIPGQLEAELLRLECGRFRMGRRPDRRTSSGGWRTANWTASIRR